MVRKVVGAKPSDEELKTLKGDLEKGQRAIQVDNAAGLFGKNAEKLNQAGEAMGKVAEGIGKGLEVSGDIRAILEIHDALKS